MILGYNTNGFAHHRLEDALEIIAEIGYRGVAITLEHDLLDPPDTRGVERALSRLGSALSRTSLTSVIETGARFILDPRRKHQPTMASRHPDDRRKRIEYLKASIDVAAGLGSVCVSLWSGRADDDAHRDELWARLTESMMEVLDHARDRGVTVGFEPEPGMFIERMKDFEHLTDVLSLEPSPNPLPCEGRGIRGRSVDGPWPSPLGLTLDVGHVHCLSDGDVATHVSRWSSRLCNVHLEDMRRGVHEHLVFGDGDFDVRGVMRSLRTVGYGGPVNVELSRHSHDAVDVARRSYEYLSAILAE